MEEPINILRQYIAAIHPLPAEEWNAFAIASYARLKAGDTLRFLIAHHQRHFVPIENTLSAVKKG